LKKALAYRESIVCFLERFRAGLSSGPRAAVSLPSLVQCPGVGGG
jgi:hypothetical protein